MKRTKLLLTGSILGMVAAVVAPAYAQDAQPAAAEDAAVEEDDS